MLHLTSLLLRSSIGIFYLSRNNSSGLAPLVLLFAKCLIFQGSLPLLRIKQGFGNALAGAENGYDPG
jgi:hypothetical protein